jgi:hypothetical protein
MFSVNTFLWHYWCWMCPRFYPVCSLNTVLIIIRPCATRLKSARFLCFFFLLYFRTCFSIISHHHKYRMCSRSLHCFLFDILDGSRCFMQVMLRLTTCLVYVCWVCCGSFCVFPHVFSVFLDFIAIFWTIYMYLLDRRKFSRRL